MAKINYGNYRGMTIPMVENVLRQHRWLFSLAERNRIPANNPFLEMIYQENKKANEAIVILKMESKLHNLKQDLELKKYEYDLKWGDDE